MKKPRAADALYKQQATRLKEFLQNGGVTIKHANALEAVAAMHGAKDFHTLKHSAAKEAENSGVTYVVNSFGLGQFVDSCVSNDLQLAVASFLQFVRMYSDLLPEDTVIVAGVSGGARTEGLYCFVEDTLVANLIQASVADAGEKFIPPVPDAKALSDLMGLAYNLSATLARRDELDWQKRREAVKHSAAARNLSMDPIDEIYPRAAEFYTEATVDESTVAATRKMLDSVDVYGSMRVVVQEGGYIEI